MSASPSTFDRPLRLRARADVLAAAVRVPGGGRWVLTDPVTREHFELSEQEQAILGWLSEPTGGGDLPSLLDLQHRFDHRFAPQRIDAGQLWQYLGRLHDAGLVVSTGKGQGDELWRRDQRRRQEQRRWAWTRLLAIRLPSFDPDRLLTTLHAVVGWVFRPWALALLACLVLCACVTAVSNAGRLAADLPSLSSLVEARSLLWLAVVAVVVKVFHELGHALTCKHFGGEVREMGVMLLAFAPCLYCDVSDMWRLPSRGKRLAVSAAGMAVEVVLAALAVLVWRLAEPGLVSSLALSVMVVCTVGTVLVNANPLLRYDGYYLLSDLTNSSNLWQRSRDAVRQRLSSWLMRPTGTATKPAPLWLTAYGVASQIYVVVIVTTVLWLLMATLKPLRLDSLAWIAGAVCLAGVAAGPVRGALRWSRNPAATRRLRRTRATLTAVVVAALFAVVLRIPWTYTVEGQATTVLDDPQYVVATIGGQITEALEPGTRVETGAVIARLRNLEIHGDLQELAAKVAEQALRVEQLQSLRQRDPEANQALPAEQAALEDYRQRLQERRAEADRLVLRATRAGVVIAAPRVESNTADATKLPTWQGHPLERENRGAWIEPGALICLVGKPEQLAVQALLPEEDVDRLRDGQAARVALWQTPGVVLRGQVVKSADVPLRPAAPNTAAPLISNWSPLQPPASAPGAHYRVQVRLDPHNAPLVVGGRGRIKIDTGRSTLGHWLTDGLRQTFRLP